MRNQAKSVRNSTGKNVRPWRTRLWREIKRPLLVGLIIGVVACVLILLAFGTAQAALFLMATIAGTCLAMPFLMLAAGYLLGTQHDD